MPVSNVELLKGTLDLLILRTLELSPMHGSAIAERIAQVTQGTFQVRAGSLSRPFIGWNRRGGSRGNGANRRRDAGSGHILSRAMADDS